MPLSDDALDSLLDGRHVAVLATIGRRGRPHQAPVWYLWRDGRALVITATWRPEGAQHRAQRHGLALHRHEAAAVRGGRDRG